MLLSRSQPDITKGVREDEGRQVVSAGDLVQSRHRYTNSYASTPAVTTASVRYMGRTRMAMGYAMASKRWGIDSVIPKP